MKKSAGFTLIELLIVIAIISILAAIIFPVFAQAREKARQTACLSNEKQIALGVLMYTQDYDEVIPPTANMDGTLWPAEITAYVNNAKVFLCPSDSADTFISYGLNEIAFSDLTDSGALPPATLSSFQTPAATLMVGELGVGTEGNPSDLTTVRVNAYKCTAPDVDLNDNFDGRPSARHFLRANIGLMDGHVKALRMEQFYVGQTPADLWFTP